MNTENTERRVDQNELRTNQLFMIALLLTGYALDRWELIAFQAAVFLLMAVSWILGPHIALYRIVLQPLGIVRPDWRADNMEAHRFTGVIGLVVSSIAAYCLYAGYTSIGWGLVWLMVALGGLAFAGWCAGCFMYYMIQKTGVKGFFQYASIGKGLPGARPPK